MLCSSVGQTVFQYLCKVLVDVSARHARRRMSLVRESHALSSTAEQTLTNYPSIVRNKSTAGVDHRAYC